MWKLAIATTMALALATPVAAQDYPTKPVRVVVPYNAGGAVDYLGRVLAQELSETLGQQFVVENRAGASGNIGAQFVATSQPDGYTLLMTSVTSAAITTGLHPDEAGYDLKKDFKAVGMAGLVPFVLVAGESVEVNDMKGFISYAQQQSQPLAYGSSGVGSAEHLGMELLAGLANIELLHVPYTGAAPAVADLVAGRIPIMVASVPTALPQIEAGELKPLAVALGERVDSLPNVPNAAEAGFDDFNVVSLYGVLAPKDVPADVLEKLGGAIAKIASDPDFVAKLTERGIVRISDNAGSAQHMFEADVDKWRKLISETDLSEN